MGKRAIGRPVKYHIRSRGMAGWIELVFAPRNKVEEYVSSAIKFIHPYLFFVTYRFHVEKAREGGKYLKFHFNVLSRKIRFCECFRLSNIPADRFLHSGIYVVSL